MYTGYVNGRNCGFHNYTIDDFEIVQGCDCCDIGHHCSECPKDCFEYLGRGDGVLVLIKDGECVKAIDTDDIFDYNFNKVKE